jgi:hypothetical protein
MTRTRTRPRAATTARAVDLKRVHRQLYTATPQPAVVHAPELPFLMIDGKGDLNDPGDRAGVQALFAVAYTLRTMLKNGPAASAYTVMPLQGRWWSADGGDISLTLPRELWRATMMILQPPEVTGELFAEAAAAAADRKPHLPVTGVRLEPLAEGRCAQILHLGPYSQEGPTIARLQAFIREQGRTIAGLHHEIYLSAPDRVAPEKLRTIIRYPVTG